MTARDDIIAHEGRVPYVYRDSLGVLTAGIGFNIDKDHGGNIPDKVMDFWLDYFIAEKESQLDQHLAWWRGRSQSVQDALVDMAYELGIYGLLKFSRMLAALQAGDYETAKMELKASALYGQVPRRCEDNMAKFHD